MSLPNFWVAEFMEEVVLSLGGEQPTQFATCRTDRPHAQVHGVPEPHHMALGDEPDVAHNLQIVDP